MAADGFGARHGCARATVALAAAEALPRAAG